MKRKKIIYPHEWPLIAWIIKNRAGWKCEHCDHLDDFHLGHALTVHHLDFNPLNCDHTNLVALCQRCHLSVRSWFNPLQNWFDFGKPKWVKERVG